VLGRKHTRAQGVRSSGRTTIAEGAARHSQAEFNQFLHIAMGSCSELDTQLELSYRLSYLSKDIWNDLDHNIT
jgi:four helix bundle protein